MGLKMNHANLIQNVFNNTLTIDEQMTIAKAMNTPVVLTALKVNEFFLLGHRLDHSDNGAYVLASEVMGCHPSTCQRNYNKLYPKRVVFIERPIEPALSFPMAPR